MRQCEPKASFWSGSISDICIISYGFFGPGSPDSVVDRVAAPPSSSSSPEPMALVTPERQAQRAQEPEVDHQTLSLFSQAISSPSLALETPPSQSSSTPRSQKPAYREPLPREFTPPESPEPLPQQSQTPGHSPRQHHQRPQQVFSLLGPGPSSSISTQVPDTLTSAADPLIDPEAGPSFRKAEYEDALAQVRPTLLAPAEGASLLEPSKKRLPKHMATSSAQKRAGSELQKDSSSRKPRNKSLKMMSEEELNNLICPVELTRWQFLSPQTRHDGAVIAQQVQITLKYLMSKWLPDPELNSLCSKVETIFEEADWPLAVVFMDGNTRVCTMDADPKIDPKNLESLRNAIRDSCGLHLLSENSSSSRDALRIFALEKHRQTLATVPAFVIYRRGILSRSRSLTNPLKVDLPDALKAQAREIHSAIVSSEAKSTHFLNYSMRVSLVNILKCLTDIKGTHQILVTEFLAFLVNNIQHFIKFPFQFGHEIVWPQLTGEEAELTPQLLNFVSNFEDHIHSMLAVLPQPRRTRGTILRQTKLFLVGLMLETLMSRGLTCGREIQRYHRQFMAKHDSPVFRVLAQLSRRRRNEDGGEALEFRPKCEKNEEIRVRVHPVVERLRGHELFKRVDAGRLLGLNKNVVWVLFDSLDVALPYLPEGMCFLEYPLRNQALNTLGHVRWAMIQNQLDVGGLKYIGDRKVGLEWGGLTRYPVIVCYEDGEFEINKSLEPGLRQPLKQLANEIDNMLPLIDRFDHSSRFREDFEIPLNFLNTRIQEQFLIVCDMAAQHSQLRNKKDLHHYERVIALLSENRDLFEKFGQCRRHMQSTPVTCDDVAIGSVIDQIMRLAKFHDRFTEICSKSEIAPKFVEQFELLLFEVWAHVFENGGVTDPRKLTNLLRLINFIDKRPFLRNIIMLSFQNVVSNRAQEVANLAQQIIKDSPIQNQSSVSSTITNQNQPQQNQSNLESKSTEATALYDSTSDEDDPSAI